MWGSLMFPRAIRTTTTYLRMGRRRQSKASKRGKRVPPSTPEEIELARAGKYDYYPEDGAGQVGRKAKSIFWIVRGKSFRPESERNEKERRLHQE